jgi:GT2 family glycosyltransferase
MSGTLLSICIVTYRACDYLRDCLDSICANPPDGEYEIIVVDNHSTDGTLEMLKDRFPQVSLLINESNQGYTAPMNQALRKAKGLYLLQLNPDTLIHPWAFDRLIEFMEIHPKAGICSPKVLNTDGSLQEPCRRGESRPWAVVTYFLGLSRLFPQSQLFGGYLLNYLDENQVHEVAGVSGSCMLVRRQVIEQIGYLDERYFAYQEDADYCFQARKAGWKVYYVPTAQITHYGGQGGSRVQPYQSIIEWHRSYWLYYRKNLAADYFFLFNWLYYLAMLVKLGGTLLINALRKEKYAGRQKPR